jgi:hypothetical protein
VKLGTRILAILAILAVGGFLYWFFIGDALSLGRVEEAMPAPAEAMQVLKQGQFRDADRFHRGSGTAKVIQADGKYFLILEDFKVTAGPDLFVYLSKSPDVTDDDSLGEHKSLARLKGSEGSQVYEISKEDAEQFASAVIWCKRFGVLFASASLQ